jgi:hypothetical protein
MKFGFFMAIFLGLNSITALDAGASALGVLKREIRKDGYILYRTPLSSAGTGTLVGGSPNAMSIVADPQTCFPDVMDGTPIALRKVEDTNLGAVHRTTTFEGKAVVDLLKFMNTANSIFKIKAGIDSIQSVELEMEDAKVEYMDTVLLQDFYLHRMKDSCKKILNSVGFIVQALRVGKMKYVFKDKTGALINLSTQGISEYFDIAVDVGFHIENDYKLVIDSPKYIGYQLGRLKEADQGVAMYRSHQTLFNRYLFKSIGIFQQ